MNNSNNTAARASRTELDARLVYNKTPAGLAELTQRALGLTPAARRVLILMDGTKSIGDLPKIFRPGDLKQVIQELEQRQLVCLTGISDIRGDTSSPEADLIARFKPKLLGVFQRELQDRGIVLDARVQDAVSMDVLRSVLREGISRAREYGSPDSARRVAQAVRAMLATEPNNSSISRDLSSPNSL